MPIYEFYCPNNHRIYSFLARSLSYASSVPRCPDDPAFRLEKMISPFAVTGRAKEREGDGSGDPAEDARMEQVMREMERDFGDMADAENPDPRRLAAMMRRMSEATGEALPDAMQEMMSRMERGEDPEKLEAEYGSALDDPGMGPESGGPGESAGTTLIRRLRKAPQRDARLFEMAEYCSVV